MLSRFICVLVATMFLMGGCVSFKVEKVTPPCMKVVSKFLEQRSDDELLLPPLTFPLHGTVYGVLNEKINQVRLLCVFSNRPDILAKGCSVPNDLTEQCKQADGSIKVWTEAVEPWDGGEPPVDPGVGI